MAGATFCEPRHLYNIINQYRRRSRLTEPNYLCLLDARSQREFDDSHIITAQRIVLSPEGEYLVPNPQELGYVRFCVVYDFDTGFLVEEEKETGSSAVLETEISSSDTMCSQDTEEGDALFHARNLGQFTHHPVLVLKGGYRRFSACYHFLKSQKALWMPQELDTIEAYPVEILHGKLYMGNFKQASDKQIQKDLKIKALVNVCEQPVTLFAEEGKSLHVSVPDSFEADLFSSFPTIAHFIDAQLEVGAVLVFSSLGISRCSTATMAYLMHSCRFSLQADNSHSLTESMAVQKSKAEPFQISCHSSQLASTDKSSATDSCMILQPIQAEIFESFQKGKSKAELGCAALDCISDQYRAWKYLLNCKMNMRPNPGFVEQLSAWETKIYGSPVTDISRSSY